MQQSGCSCTSIRKATGNLQFLKARSLSRPQWKIQTITEEDAEPCRGEQLGIQPGLAKQGMGDQTARLCSLCLCKPLRCGSNFKAYKGNMKENQRKLNKEQEEGKAYIYYIDADATPAAGLGHLWYQGDVREDGGGGIR